MSRRSLFWKIVARSVLVGLQAGAVLGFTASLFLMLSIGFWAIVIGVGYGCVIGAVLGFLNGLLIAGLICRFFFPFTPNRLERRVTQAGSIVFSLLITAAVIKLISGPSGLDTATIKVFAAAAFPVVGASAWWASWRVSLWYEQLSFISDRPTAPHTGEQDSLY